MGTPMDYSLWQMQMQAKTESAVRGLIEHDPEINQEPLFPCGQFVDRKIDELNERSTTEVKDKEEDTEQEKLRRLLKEEQERQWNLDQERRRKEEERMKEWRIQQKKEQEDSSITRREEARSKVRDVWIASFQQEVESTRKRKMRQIEERNSKRTKKMEAIEQKEITEFDCQVFEKASTIQLPNEKEEGNNE